MVPDPLEEPLDVQFLLAFGAIHPGFPIVVSEHDVAWMRQKFRFGKALGACVRDQLLALGLLLAQVIVMADLGIEDFLLGSVLIDRARADFDLAESIRDSQAG